VGDLYGPLMMAVEFYQSNKQLKHEEIQCQARVPRELILKGMESISHFGINIYIYLPTCLSINLNGLI